MIDYDKLEKARQLTRYDLNRLHQLANQLCEQLKKHTSEQSAQRLTLAEKHRDLIFRTYQAIQALGLPVRANDDESQLRYQKKLLQHIEQLQGDWQSRGVWKAIAEQLANLSDSLQVSLQPIGYKPAKKHTVTQKSHQPTVKTAFDTTIYIHLYQATGKPLSLWISQLQNLQHLAQSRPVYDNQEAVITVLNERGNLITDAYVAVKVPKAALVATFRGRSQTDKYGQTLVTLDMDLWPDLPNVSYFYHDNKLYHWTGEELVL